MDIIKTLLKLVSFHSNNRPLPCDLYLDILKMKNYNIDD